MTLHHASRHGGGNSRRALHHSGQGGGGGLLPLPFTTGKHASRVGDAHEGGRAEGREGCRKGWMEGRRE